MTAAAQDTFEILLLTEMRLLSYEPGDSCAVPGQGAEVPAAPDPESLARAVTINEELLRGGYTLRPEDLALLAFAKDPGQVLSLVTAAIPEVKADPMYRNFPAQVMQMDEAVFRMHQLIHYFSVYNMEELTGQMVPRGWMPPQPDTEKTETDERLLAASVVKLIPAREAPLAVLGKILGKRERMTRPEEEIVRGAVRRIFGQPADSAGNTGGSPADAAVSIYIPFKENLRILFDAVFAGTDGPHRVRLLHSLCQHTGDVLKCAGYVLGRRQYHLHTSEKRALVRLLESYPEKDFRENLALSRKHMRKNKTLLRFLDYNQYTRSAPHKEAADALRDGSLRSWESGAEKLLAEKAPEAVSYLAARPGMMLRRLRRLLSLGYPEEQLTATLTETGASMSLYTVVDILNALDRKEASPPLPSLRKEAINFANEKLEMAEAPLHLPLAYLSRNAAARRDKLLRNPLPVRAAVEKQIRKETAGIEKRFASRVRSMEDIPAVRRVLLAVLAARLSEARTELYGKKVYTDLSDFLPERSRIEAGQKSAEGGCVPSGMAYRIPDGARHVRLFVYWNDPQRVDVDLHAYGYDRDGTPLHVGWSGDFRAAGMATSGDITHSDAAEYIDIDLDADVREAAARIHLYDGKDGFADIETCFAGLMAVHSLDEKVRLYDPANCFFHHVLRSPSRWINYGYVDVPHRCVVFIGEDGEGRTKAHEFTRTPLLLGDIPLTLSLDRYLSILFDGQKCVTAETPEEADVILTVEPRTDLRAVSLLEKHFFLE